MFLLRTGITLVYDSKERDFLQPEYPLEALTKYCRENLKGCELEGIPLDVAPGVADWAIWYFSRKPKKREMNSKIARTYAHLGISIVRTANQRSILYHRMQRKPYFLLKLRISKIKFT